MVSCQAGFKRRASGKGNETRVTAFTLGYERIKLHVKIWERKDPGKRFVVLLGSPVEGASSQMPSRPQWWCDTVVSY